MLFEELVIYPLPNDIVIWFFNVRIMYVIAIQEVSSSYEMLRLKTVSICDYEKPFYCKSSSSDRISA